MDLQLINLIAEAIIYIIAFAWLVKAVPRLNREAEQIKREII